MKKFISCVACFFIFATVSFAQKVDFNEENLLELKEVVQLEGASQGDIYLAAQSMLSDWSYNQNSQMKIDYSDKATGVVISKGRIYIGCKKLGLLYGWDVFADYSMTIKAKDNRYQVTIKVPSMYFKHNESVSAPEETVPISTIYPEYGYKGQYKLKGACKEYASSVPDVMKGLFNAIKSKIKNGSSEDDF